MEKAFLYKKKQKRTVVLVTLIKIKKLYIDLQKNYLIFKKKSR